MNSDSIRGFHLLFAEFKSLFVLYFNLIVETINQLIASGAVLQIFFFKVVAGVFFFYLG